LALLAVLGLLSVGALFVDLEVDPKHGFGWGDAIIAILVGAGIGLAIGLAVTILIYGRHWTPPANASAPTTVLAGGLGILVWAGPPDIAVGVASFCIASVSFLIMAWAIKGRHWEAPMT
jgi:hypothetical protein